ncbi:MAG: tRNA (guanine-N7)-methyltransferase [Sandaracinus sp.]|nr:tRNA (guanine-N7)-methyltransferase [Sandaracinus sp.]
MTEGSRTEIPVPYATMAPRPAEEGPLDLDALVPGEGPIELDIGFGRGMSVFRRAQTAPDARMLALEIKAKWSFKVAERVKRLGLDDRILVWACDARETLARSGPDGIVSRAFVHFPDPWWKKRHTKRRVLGDDFLVTLARLMRPGGDLFVQTDVEDRHALYVEFVNASPDFEIVNAELDHNPFGSVSNREIRAEEDGLPIHRLLARRR